MKIINGENVAYQSGVYFKRFIVHEIEKQREKINSVKNNGSLYEVFNKVNNFFPDYVEEVKQKALGSDVDYMDLFALYCQELLESGSGCSTILYKSNNNTILLAHNEDDDFEYGNSALTVYSNGDFKAVSCDYYSSPLGNAFSWNSYGMVITINYVAVETPDILAIPAQFAARHLMESVSIDDAISKLNSIKNIVSSGYNFNIVDSKANRACSIELAPGLVIVNHLNKYLAHTNHYLSEAIPDYRKADFDSNTLTRFDKLVFLINEQINSNPKDLTMSNLHQCLCYHDDNHDYTVFFVNSTGFQFLFSTEDRKITIYECFGLKDRETFCFDYDELF